MIDSRIADAFLKAHGWPLEEHLIVLARVGSHSHGTYCAPSEPDAIDDVDFMGFVVPPIEYHLGLKEFDSWVFQFEELDVVIYSLRKAFTLLLKCNPNIVGTLWLRDEDYIHTTQAWSTLWESADLFTSKAAAEAFIGYSYSQLKKMEAFDVERMDLYDNYTRYIGMLGLDPQAVLSKHPDQMHELIPEGRYMTPNPDSWSQYSREEVADCLRHFRKLHKEHYSGYLGAKRKAMIRKYSYDVKNASHMVRLLRMGSEFLSSGQLNVFRTEDAQELKDIKQGRWTLDQVKDEATRLFERIREAEETSTLPAEPDRARAEALLIRLTLQTLRIAQL
jgi:hypothetical protein